MCRRPAAGAPRCAAASRIIRGRRTVCTRPSTVPGPVPYRTVVVGRASQYYRGTVVPRPRPAGIRLSPRPQPIPVHYPACPEVRRRYRRGR
eukprot:194430-Hanusia_phi.AAC.1